MYVIGKKKFGQNQPFPRTQPERQYCEMYVLIHGTFNTDIMEM